MISLKDLNLETKIDTTTISLAEGVEATVRKYLPMNDKIRLLQYVLDLAIDDNTGCFSPVRVETYFILGLMKFYADIDIKGLSEPEAYDLLETNGISDMIIHAIPTSEFEFMQSLLVESVEQAQKYNTSAAGIIQNMTSNAGSLNDQIAEILKKVKSREGIELLDDIKKVYEIN